MIVIHSINNNWRHNVNVVIKKHRYTLIVAKIYKEFKENNNENNRTSHGKFYELLHSQCRDDQQGTSGLITYIYFREM